MGGPGGGVKLFLTKKGSLHFPQEIEKKKCVSSINPETLKTSIDFFFKKIKIKIKNQNQKPSCHGATFTDSLVYVQEL